MRATRLLIHLIPVVAALCAVTGEGRVFLTQQQALSKAFGPSVKVQRQSIFLTPQQVSAARKESGLDFDQQLLVRYAGSDGRYAYFDTHRVRTLAETVMIVVGADGRIEEIEILAFDEPADYLPKRRWLDQLLGRRLDRELALNRAIRPISGASLSGRSIVNAGRKVLAIHRVIGATPAP
ncbi:MAG TPA: FMN-binding protein [Thermoanaerobaculia bacterium]|nr:FMN-binding protein [Thermoanaerobaculia bacterium]